MACHFSANQFEPEFASRKLSNWEVPKWPHPSRPQRRTGATKIISNERGHLLPGIPRPETNPWGNFKGTWQLPDRITKQTAHELHSSPVCGSRWQKSFVNKAECEDTDQGFQQECEANFSDTNHNTDKDRDLEYIPGTLTTRKARHPSHEILLQQKFDQKSSTEPIIEGNDLNIDPYTCTDRLLNDEIKKRRELEDDQKSLCPSEMKEHFTLKPHNIYPSPIIVPAEANFCSARKMAQDNLEHQPLPDAVSSVILKKLKSIGTATPSEFPMDMCPRATGVGIRSYKAGPTQCTKMKIFRPKTCGIVPQPLDRTELPNGDRPHTCKKTIGKMGPMELAICWDFRPEDPRDEPKRPTHIDGSNESAGPAVFTLVKTPRTPSPMDTGRTGGLFVNTIGSENFFDNDIMRRNRGLFQKQDTQRPCTCGNSEKTRRRPDISQSAIPKQAVNQELLAQRRRCKSSPNLSSDVVEDSSPCRLVCVRHLDASQLVSGDVNKQKEKLPKTRVCDQKQKKATSITYQHQCAYRAAPFRTGIPNSNSAGTRSSFDSGCSSITSNASSKVVHVPKPKNPYAKKNYTIETLHPPFACCRGGAGQGGYPEHWRLASVYQHAYKPIEMRKRPLLATVYK